MKYKTHREHRGAWVFRVPVEVGKVSSNPPGILYVVLQRLAVSILYEGETEAQSQRNQLRCHHG